MNLKKRMLALLPTIAFVTNLSALTRHFQSMIKDKPLLSRDSTLTVFPVIAVAGRCPIESRGSFRGGLELPTAPPRFNVETCPQPQ